MAIPVRIKRFPGEIGKRLWRPRWLWAIPATLAYDWWVSPWLEDTVKPWLEDEAGLVPEAGAYVAEHPWLIPIIAVSITLIVIVIHAYVSAGTEALDQTPGAAEQEGPMRVTTVTDSRGVPRTRLELSDPAVEPTPCSRDAELEVCIEKQEWREFINASPPVLGLLAKVRAANLTDTEKHLGMQMEISRDGVHEEMIDELDPARPLHSWLHSKPKFLGHLNEKGSVAEGWIALTFKRNPQGGRPAVKITITYAGKDYPMYIPEVPPRHYSA